MLVYDLDRKGDVTYYKLGALLHGYTSRNPLQAALTLTEGRYCCVRLENKKRGTTMDRVYVHAVFTKPL